METTGGPRTGSRRPYLADLLILLLLLVLAGKLTWDLSSVADLTIGDEVSYMSCAEGISAQGLPSAQASPLYCLWYYALSLVKPDHVALYYANWSVLTALVPVGVYVLFRALGGSRLLGLLTAFGVLTSGLVTIWPYLTHLATGLLLLGSAVAVRVRQPAWSVAVLGLTLLLAAYIRPECAVAFLGLCLLGLVAAVWLLRRRGASLPQLFLPALVLV